jgi:hypothetical protein
MRDANAVHEMVPVKPAGVETTMKLVVDMLKANPDKWYTSSQIADAIDRRSGNTEPGIRKAIAIALECYGVPIIASDRGYMFTTDNEMVTRYIDSLAQRIRGVQARIAALQRIVSAHHAMQPVAGSFDEKALDDELLSCGALKAPDIIRLAQKHGVLSGTVMKRYMTLFPPDTEEIERHYSSPETRQWIA